MKRRKIVLLGAGSAVFTQGLVADFILAEGLGKWEIALVDIDEKTLEAIKTLVERMVEMKQADLLISSSTNRREVLPGADVVVTTIAVGGRRAWETDVFIPRNYGVFQPVGDTTMPGGISRALRMIPVMVEIAKDVKELCPNAYFFNYSNPMTAICTAIGKEVGIPVTGLCHGVNHVEHYLKDYLDESNSKITSLAVGLNHLTFLYDIRLNGEDVLPLLLETYRKRKNESGTNVNEDNPFSWWFFEKYGVFPAVLDRHVVEFFPERFASGDYYNKTLGINAFSIEKVISDGDKVYEEMFSQAAGDAPLNERLFNRSEGEHEQLVEILKSLYTDHRKTFSVNLPNQGSIPNLPDHAVLEMPAVASGAGFVKLLLMDFPEIPAAFIRRRLTVIDLTVEAALKGDFTLFVEALLADGSVKNEETARKLATDLVKAHRDYLPQF